MDPSYQDNQKSEKESKRDSRTSEQDIHYAYHSGEKKSFFSSNKGTLSHLVQKWLDRIKRGFLHPTILMMFGTPNLKGEYPLMTGSEIIQKIHEVSLDHWKPSPGSLYPILSEMQEDNLLELVPRSNKKAKTYRITELGLQMLNIITSSSILLTQPRGTFPPTMKKDSIQYLLNNQYKNASLDDLVKLQKFYLFLADLATQMIESKLNS
jgi:DNA-binding PadR family transcriptional regulator